jgi:hypothetical protein
MPDAPTYLHHILVFVLNSSMQTAMQASHRMTHLSPSGQLVKKRPSSRKLTMALLASTRAQSTILDSPVLRTQNQMAIHGSAHLLKLWQGHHV